MRNAFEMALWGFLPGTVYGGYDYDLYIIGVTLKIIKQYDITSHVHFLSSLLMSLFCLFIFRSTSSIL